MSTRLGDAAASSIERLLGGSAGPQLETQAEHRHPGAGGSPSGAPSGSEYKCPVCNAPRNDYGGERARYDEDYDYYWGEWRLPLWIALIWQVPWRQRLDIFIIGFIIGLVIAGVAVSWGLLLSRY